MPEIFYTLNRLRFQKTKNASEQLVPFRVRWLRNSILRNTGKKKKKNIVNPK